MKIVVNWALCDGNGNCAKQAPTIFSMGEDDNLVVLKETIGADDRVTAEAAVRVCPKRALSLDE